MAKDDKGHGSNPKSPARGPGFINYDKPSKPAKSGNTGRSSHFTAAPGREDRVAEIAKNKADRLKAEVQRSIRKAKPETGFGGLPRSMLDRSGRERHADIQSKVRSTTQNRKY